MELLEKTEYPAHQEERGLKVNVEKMVETAVQVSETFTSRVLVVDTCKQCFLDLYTYNVIKSIEQAMS